MSQHKSLVKKLNYSQRADVLKMYDELDAFGKRRYTVDLIAAKYNCTRSTIIYHVKRHGTKTRNGTCTSFRGKDLTPEEQAFYRKLCRNYRFTSKEARDIIDRHREQRGTPWRG